MPKLQVQYVSATSIGLFEQNSQHYGEIWYELDGRKVMSRVTTAEGVLEAIYQLAGLTAAGRKRRRRCSADTRSRVPPKGAATVFYRLWPALVAAAAFFEFEETCMKTCGLRIADRGRCCRAVRAGRLRAADVKVDLSKETVGRPPATFEPMVGTWLVAQDGADKVDHDRRPAVGGQQGQPDEAARRNRAQAVRHHQRRADGQRETVRLLPGRRAREASTRSRTARSP